MSSPRPSGPHRPARRLAWVVAVLLEPTPLDSGRWLGRAGTPDQPLRELRTAYESDLPPPAGERDVDLIALPYAMVWARRRTWRPPRLWTRCGPDRSEKGCNSPARLSMTPLCFRRSAPHSNIRCYGLACPESGLGPSGLQGCGSSSLPARTDRPWAGRRP